MFGVLTCGCPPSGVTQSLRSSMAMNSTLGFSAARATDPNARAATSASAQRMTISDVNGPAGMRYNAAVPAIVPHRARHDNELPMSRLAILLPVALAALVATQG